MTVRPSLYSPRWFYLFPLTVRSCLDSGPDDPITQPTNRGNKLHTNSNFVREGALGYIHPEELYKQVSSTPAALERSLFHGGISRSG